MASKTGRRPAEAVSSPAESAVDAVPDGLAAAGTRLWVSIVAEFELQTHESLMLTEACRVADTLDRLALAAVGAELTVHNARGDEIANPLLSEARQQQVVFSRLLASLRLPAGEVDGRPQRRGASRGTYGIKGSVA